MSEVSDDISERMFHHQRMTSNTIAHADATCYEKPVDVKKTERFCANIGKNHAAGQFVIDVFGEDGKKRKHPKYQKVA